MSDHPALNRRPRRPFAARLVRCCRVLGWLSLSLLGLTLTSLKAEVTHHDVVFVAIDEDTKDLFEADPPSTLDLATFLLNLKKHQPSACAVAAPWQWPATDPTTIKLLARQTEGLPFFYGLILELDEAAPASEETLLRLFPKGLTIQTSPDTDAARFSSIASHPHPRLLEGAPKGGFIGIDFGAEPQISEEGLRTPLLARGPEGEWMPSLSLALACQALGISWQEVDIEIPGNMRLGDNPEPITLDASGSVLLPLATRASLTKISGAVLNPVAIDGGIDPHPAVQGQAVVFGEDHEEARGFLLPDGTSISRAEAVAWTAQALVTLATTIKPPPPPPEEEPEAKADPQTEAVEAGQGPGTTVDPEALATEPENGPHPIAQWWKELRNQPPLMWVAGSVLFVIIMLFLMMRSIARASPYQPRNVASITEPPKNEGISADNPSRSSPDEEPPNSTEEEKQDTDDEQQDKPKEIRSMKSPKKNSKGDTV